MQSISTPARSITCARIAGYAAATAAAWYALGGATDANSLTPLFGWQRLIVVQVVMTLPLGIFAALVLQKCVPVAWRRSLALAGSAAGLVATLLVAMIVPLIGRAVENGGLNLWMLVLMRAILCVAVELPWCVGLESLVAAKSDDSICADKETIASRGLVGNCRTWRGDRAAGRLCRGFDSQANGCGERLARATTACGGRSRDRALVCSRQQSPAARSRADDGFQEARSHDRCVERKSRSGQPGARRGTNGRVSPRLGDARSRGRRASVACALGRNVRDAALLLAATMQEQSRWQESPRQFAVAARLLREMPDSCAKKQPGSFRPSTELPTANAS